MFQFTTTTLINNKYALDVNGDPKLDSNGDPLQRVLVDEIKGTLSVIGTQTKFVKEGIVSVFKRAYAAPKRAVSSLTIPAADKDTILRITVLVSLTKPQSHYVNFNLDFEQPLTIDITSTGNASQDAALFTKALNRLKIRYGTIFVASSVGAKITFTAREPEQVFKSIIVEEVGDLVGYAPKLTVVAKGEIVTRGEPGFGTDSWMIRTVVAPNGPNISPFGTTKDERPVMGGNYSQYTLRYITSSGEDCVWNGAKQSVTNHVFWVREDLVDMFEDELAEIVTIQGIDGTLPTPKPIIEAPEVDPEP